VLKVFVPILGGKQHDSLLAFTVELMNYKIKIIDFCAVL
jgi:hypothetical protein